MSAFKRIPLSIVEPITPQKLAQGGAAVNHVPVWNGTNYTPQNPVIGFANGVNLGRAAEINITGGANTTRTGNRLNIEVLSGAVAVNGQQVTAINTGANISASVSGGIATISATSGLSGISINNSGNFQNINFTGAGVSVIGNTVTIAGGGGSGSYTEWRLQTATAPFGTILAQEAITQNGVVRFVAGAGVSIAQTSLGAGGTALTISASGTGASTTLTHSGVGSALFTGAGANYTMKGIRSLSAGLNITDTGSSLDFQLTGAGSASLNVFNNGLSVGMAQGLNFLGFQSVINNAGTVFVTAPSGGGGGITGVQVNGTGNFQNINFTGAGVSVAGNTVTVAGASGGGGSLAILNTGAFFMPAVTTLDVWGAASLQNMGGGMARLVIPSGGGGGITGVQINNAGNYTNINFNGAGVSVAGNTVTVFGATSGLTGITANGLVIGTNTVQLNLANTASAGAMPTLSGLVNQYLAGNGTWQNIPTGGGGAVNSVSSGAPSVLSVTPTSGNVVVTPIGFSGTFTPSLSGTTLAIPNHTLVNGITTSIGTTIVTLPSGGSSYTHPSFTPQNFTPSISGNQLTVLGASSNNQGHVTGFSSVTLALPVLPTGAINQTMRHNGVEWRATNDIRIDDTGIVTLGANVRGLINNSLNSMFFGSWAGVLAPHTFSVAFGNLPSNPFTTPRSYSFYVAGGQPSAITFEVNTFDKAIGFFGATPIPRPSTTNDITSVRNALIALGLIT